MPEDPRQRPIVYALPGMERAHVQKDLAYTHSLGETLHADVYAPEGAAARERLPAVIFISGDAPPELMRGLKDAGQYVGWGQLAAASGMVGVMFNHHSTETYQRLVEVAGEIEALLAFVRERADELGIDTSRLAIWTCSGGPPFGLREALLARPPSVRCTVIYYGLLDPRVRLDATDPPEMIARLTEYAPVTYLGRGTTPLAPLLVVRAGRDRPGLNWTTDAFVAEALAWNAPLELINYPEGQHAFDVLDDTEASRAILQRTLAFLCQHLSGA